MSEEEYRNHSDIIDLPEWGKTFYYLTYVGRYEDYDYAIDYLAKNLRNLEELIQARAIEVLSILVSRFYNIKEHLILPLLLENLKSTSEKILDKTLETLADIAIMISKLRLKTMSLFKKRLLCLF